MGPKACCVLRSLGAMASRESCREARQPSLVYKPCHGTLDHGLATHSDTPQLLGPALKPKLGKPATLRFHMHASASAAPPVALVGWQNAACGRGGSPAAVYAAGGLTARSSAGEQARTGTVVDQPCVLLVLPRSHLKKEL